MMILISTLEEIAGNAWDYKGLLVFSVDFHLSLC